MVQGEILFQVLLKILMTILLNHLVNCSAEWTPLGNFGRGIIGNNSLKLFWIWTSGSDVILRHFLFRVLVAILFDGAEPLGNFGKGHYEELL